MPPERATDCIEWRRHDLKSAPLPLSVSLFILLSAPLRRPISMNTDLPCRIENNRLTSVIEPKLWRGVRHIVKGRVGRRRALNELHTVFVAPPRVPTVGDNEDGVKRSSKKLPLSRCLSVPAASLAYPTLYWPCKRRPRPAHVNRGHQNAKRDLWLYTG